MEKIAIELPNNWVAREYQQPFFNYMLATPEGMGFAERKRACLVLHRRAGKDVMAMNFTAISAHKKVATYWHCLPTGRQARKVVWEAKNPHTGVSLIDQAFPEQLRKSKNETDMKVEFKIGSIWYAVGSDTYDRLVGTSPYGVVFSEYSLCDPDAWNYIRPILVATGGWAILIHTPRGENHGFQLYTMAKKNPRWFAMKLTVEDTFKSPGVPVMSSEDIQNEREEGVSESNIQQEYYCSFESANEGAYYFEQTALMKLEERIGDYPYIPELPVITAWDLGMGDYNYIIFAQPDGDYIRIIDVEYGSGRTMIEWIKIVKNKPYIYEEHFAPHDIRVRDYSFVSDTPRTRKEVAELFGLYFSEVPRLTLEDGIDATRTFFKRLRINEPKCEHLWSSLKAYTKSYDKINDIWRDTPAKGWANHGSDALRYLAISWHEDRPYYPPSDGRGRVIQARQPTVISSLRR